MHAWATSMLHCCVRDVGCVNCELFAKKLHSHGPCLCSCDYNVFCGCSDSVYLDRSGKTESRTSYAIPKHYKSRYPLHTCGWQLAIHPQSKLNRAVDVPSTSVDSFTQSLATHEGFAAARVWHSVTSSFPRLWLASW